MFLPAFPKKALQVEFLRNVRKTKSNWLNNLAL